jgi:hypothetical protein
MVIATAPDGTEKVFDTADHAVAWANDPEAVAAWCQHHAALAMQAAQQAHARHRAPSNPTIPTPGWARPMHARHRASSNPAIPAPGWSVRYRRATDDWEAARGAQREVFGTEAEAIAFTHA